MVPSLLPPANHKPRSNAVLSLLGQVNTALKALKSSDDMATVPYVKLQKQCKAMDSTIQQQLFILNIALQTFKLVSNCLDYLNKALGPSDINKTSDLLNDPQVAPKIVNFNSNIEFMGPPSDNSHSAMSSVREVVAL
ncbi:hypothetical protein C0989_008318 [Termitomyces sp. Mn162]|nr:hypothetical protein C0989_008318 [Termitomyces sp. Mn162]